GWCRAPGRSVAGFGAMASPAPARHVIRVPTPAHLAPLRCHRRTPARYEVQKEPPDTHPGQIPSAHRMDVTHVPAPTALPAPSHESYATKTGCPHRSTHLEPIGFPNFQGGARCASTP